MKGAGSAFSIFAIAPLASAERSSAPSGTMSSSSTGTPALARCAAMPAPMTPAPITAARLMGARSEEHTSELQSLMRISYAVFCLKQKNTQHLNTDISQFIINTHLQPCYYRLSYIGTSSTDRPTYYFNT